MIGWKSFSPAGAPFLALAVPWTGEISPRPHADCVLDGADNMAPAVHNLCIASVPVAGTSNLQHIYPSHRIGMDKMGAGRCLQTCAVTRLRNTLSSLRLPLVYDSAVRPTGLWICSVLQSVVYHSIGWLRYSHQIATHLLAPPAGHADHAQLCRPSEWQDFLPFCRGGWNIQKASLGLQPFGMTTPVSSVRVSHGRPRACCRQGRWDRHKSFTQVTAVRVRISLTLSVACHGKAPSPLLPRGGWGKAGGVGTNNQASLGAAAVQCPIKPYLERHIARGRHQLSDATGCATQDIQAAAAGTLALRRQRRGHHSRARREAAADCTQQPLPLP